MHESCLRQWIVFMPAADSALVLSMTEKFGRAAGVGCWLAGMAEIGMHCLSRPFSMPSSWIATAKSYHEATPASVQ